MPWTTTAYATLTQVKTAIDPNMTGTADDSFFNDLLTQAQYLIDDYVGYPFQLDGTPSLPAKRVFDGTGAGELMIDPCQQVTQVIEISKNTYLSSNAGIWVTGNTTTYDITADVVLGPNRVVNNYKPGYSLKRVSGTEFDQGLQNYQVYGVFGWSYIPPDVTRAIIRLVATWYKMRDTNYADLITEQGGIRERYNKTIPQDVTEILDRYKHRLFFGGAQGAW